MNGAISHFNRECAGIARPLSLPGITENPAGIASTGERVVSYAVTERDGEPVLAYFVARDSTPWNAQTYCEVSARGFVVFRTSSDVRMQVYGEPHDSSRYYEREATWLSRAASAGIPGAAEQLSKNCDLYLEHLIQSSSEMSVNPVWATWRARSFC